MNILAVLIPISTLMGLAALVAFLWSLRSDQYSDLEGDSARILFDEKERPEDE